jgi:hypothetical protein
MLKLISFCTTQLLASLATSPQAARAPNFMMNNNNNSLDSSNLINTSAYLTQLAAQAAKLFHTNDRQHGTNAPATNGARACTVRAFIHECLQSHSTWHSTFRNNNVHHNTQ